VPEPDASGRVAGVAGRGLGLLILVVLAWQVLAQGLTLPGGGGALGFIHGVNLVFHEAGHVIFGFFGEFVAALGGSLNQVLIPLIATIAFLRTRQRASAAVALFWTGQSITDVAIYAADGRARALPLLAEGLIHDWSYILGRLGLLGWAETVGRLLFAAGVLTMLAAILFLALELLRCLNAPPSRAEPDAETR
jgi:hypothetical protein